jgi:hypothetical protein
MRKIGAVFLFMVAGAFILLAWFALDALWSEYKDDPDSPSTTTTTVPPPSTNLCETLGFTGCTIVAKDYVTRADPFDAGWSYVTDGYYLTSTQSNWNDGLDQQVNSFLTGGDPSPGFDGQVHTGYRSLTTVGPQSIYDRNHQPCSTRAQVGGFGRYDRWYTFQQGTRTVLSTSVRLDTNSPLITEGRPATTTGAAGDFSMVNQWKSVEPSLNGTPTLGLDEASDGLRVWSHVNGVRHYYPIQAPHGIWIKVLMDVYWSNGSSGAYRVWADTDEGARNYHAVSPKVIGPTLQSGETGAAFNYGPYHRVSPTCGGFDGVSRNGRGYSNFEVVKHSVGDPW